MKQNILSAIFGRAVPLGIGEGVSRLANFGVIVMVGRLMGVEALGVYALGQTVAQYVLLGTDFGLKTIGARLLAVRPGQIGVIARRVQSRRVILSLVVFPLALAYALLGPMPAEARSFVFAYVLAVVPAVFALDWLLWGREKFAALGAWRAGVSLAFLAAAAYLLLGIDAGLVSLAAAYGGSWLLGAAVLWGLLVARVPPAVPDAYEPDETSDPIHIPWTQVWWMGTAWLLNQAFNNFDVLMLAGLSNSEQVGLYNAAYKLLFLLLGIYYLLTQAAFPVFARWSRSASAKRRILRWAALAFGAGATVAIGGQFLTRFALTTAYGTEFEQAAGLLRVLLIAVPFDFTVALFGTGLMAWNSPRRVAAAVGIGMAANVGLNLYLIPMLGAQGAAWATVISYVVALGAILYAFLTVEESEERHSTENGI